MHTSSADRDLYDVERGGPNDENQQSPGSVFDRDCSLEAEPPVNDVTRQVQTESEKRKRRTKIRMGKEESSGELGKVAETKVSRRQRRQKSKSMKAGRRKSASRGKKSKADEDASGSNNEKHSEMRGRGAASEYVDTSEASDTQEDAAARDFGGWSSHFGTLYFLAALAFACVHVST